MDGGREGERNSERESDSDRETSLLHEAFPPHEPYVPRFATSAGASTAAVAVAAVQVTAIRVGIIAMRGKEGAFGGRRVRRARTGELTKIPTLKF